MDHGATPARSLSCPTRARHRACTHRPRATTRAVTAPDRVAAGAGGGTRCSVPAVVEPQRSVGKALWATRGRAVTVAPGRGGGASEARTARSCLGFPREGGDASCCLTTQVAEGMRAIVDQSTWPTQRARHRTASVVGVAQALVTGAVPRRHLLAMVWLCGARRWGQTPRAARDVR